ncbi:MAG: MBL fold metallo-hydrolase [Desulfobacteraceae bacterium]|jgi:ribonuclease Z
MRPRFHPRLVNGPFEDPGLFIPFLFEKRALLFDLGDIHRLAPRDILKLTHIFISHTHMDHFIGFDHLLRLLLGREKKLWIYGPHGFLNNIEGKFAAYTWNLVNSYDHRLTINATEIRYNYLLKNTYHCSRQFKADTPAVSHPARPVIWDEPAFQIKHLILDHELPCLGFCLEERFHINICKSGLDKLGLATGPWLSDFKSALYHQEKSTDLFQPPTVQGLPAKKISLEQLRDTIAVITPGQKIAYITDTSYENAGDIIEFVKGADHLFIEAAFRNCHKEIAAEKKHLTAKQAGTLARKARVKRFTIFHYSPRYSDEAHLLEEEANQAFLG